MTQVTKTMNAKTKKSGTNFIRLEAAGSQPLTEENGIPETNKRKKRVTSGSKEAAKSRGVVYLSHIPHGFYENQIRKFFGQVCLSVSEYLHFRLREGCIV